MKQSLYLVLILFLTACVALSQSPTTVVVSTAAILPTETPTSIPIQTLTSTPEPTATAEGYVEKLIGEMNHIETVKTMYKGVPVEVNLMSHKSLMDFRHGSFNENPLTHVSLNTEFSDQGEDYQQIIAHAVMQALAEAWKLGGNATSLASELIKAPETGIPIFGMRNLDRFSQTGYKQENITFEPIRHSINIVLMNVPSKDFPGQPVKFPGLGTGLQLGYSIDSEGNLFIFRNRFSSSVAYSTSGDTGYEANNINDAVARLISVMLEGLSWRNATPSSQNNLLKALRGETVIYSILSNYESTSTVFEAVTNN